MCPPRSDNSAGDPANESAYFFRGDRHGRIAMHIVRIFPIAILAALGGYAIGMAGPARPTTVSTAITKPSSMAHALILWVAF